MKQIGKQTSEPTPKCKVCGKYLIYRYSQFGSDYKCMNCNSTYEAIDETNKQ